MGDSECEYRRSLGDLGGEIGDRWRLGGEYREISGDSELSTGDHWDSESFGRSLETWCSVYEIPETQR